MNKIAIYLNRQLHGNVFDKKTILDAYSTDRSVLKLTPKLVAFPENTDDVKKLCRFVNQLAIKDYKLPIAVRGSGLDTTGADLSTGLVISTERMNHIKEVDAHDRLVHVEAGVTLGELNSALASHGLIIPVCADPRETIGGLISNCPTDPYASRYGGISNFVDRIEVVLASGDIFQTNRMNYSSSLRKKTLPDSEGDIYRKLSRLFTEHGDAINSLKGTRNAAGYPYIQYVVRNDGKVFDTLPVFYGAQSTLGIITEVILRAEVIPPKIEHMLVSFSSFRAANEFLAFVRTLRPLELYFYDMQIINAAESTGNKPPILTRSTSSGYLVYISFADRPRASHAKVEKCLDFLPKSAKVITENKTNSGGFSAIFNALASYLNDDLEGERAPFVSDFYIPADELTGFVTNLATLEQYYKISIPLYGSYATSIYSVRPDLQLTTDSGRRFIVDFLTNFNRLVKYHYGYLCGSTPEGRLKALLTNHEFSPSEKRLFRELKDIFDPNHILAPDIKLGADPRTTSHHFRDTESQSIAS